MLPKANKSSRFAPIQNYEFKIHSLRQLVGACTRKNFEVEGRLGTTSNAFEVASRRGRRSAWTTPLATLDSRLSTETEWRVLGKSILSQKPPSESALSRNRLVEF